MRTVVALGKLADLQRRAERVADGQKGLVRPALEELSAALEELKVANEHLERQVVELTAARSEAAAVKMEVDELFDVMPIASLFTDTAGVIQNANTAAAELLSVAQARLSGKPLMLFVMNRQAFFNVLSTLRDGHVRTLTADLMIRPREHRPREVTVTVHRLEDGRCCWFMRGTSTQDVSPDAVLRAI
jgi:PAS domain-containing protein